jgi:hypothetical protein
MTSSRGVAGVAAILLAAALIQSASAATCAVKVPVGSGRGARCGSGVTPRRGARRPAGLAVRDDVIGQHCGNHEHARSRVPPRPTPPRCHQIKTSGKEPSPGKGRFKGTLCWDGLVTLDTKISFDW